MSGAPAGPAPALSTGDWEEYLSQRLSRRVRVAYGRSRTNPLQARPGRESNAPAPGATSRALGATSTVLGATSIAWQVRLHSMFAAAPLEVRAAVADLLSPGRVRRRPRPELETWIGENLSRLPPRPIPEGSLVTRGRTHDLLSIARELLTSDLREDFAEERPLPRIGWGRAGGRRTRRGMRLGSYDAEMSLVRIHPALDQPAVPEWFVRYVLFHELLHAVHPPCRGENGRWIRHGPAFRRREQTYPDLERALTWERRHIDALIRSVRTGVLLKRARSAARVASRGIQQLLFSE